MCPPERILRYPDGKERRIRYPCLPVVEEERLEEERADEALEAEPALDLSSPLAFLRHVTSETYTRRLEEENAIVRGIFDVHASCPWVVPRRVWTICVDGFGDGDREQPRGEDADERGERPSNVYFLRTRSPQTEVESELNALLFVGKKRITCSRLVDGIVVFSEVEDAEAFAAGMSVDANRTVSVAEHDSHELFRNIVECRGVGVVLRAGFGDELAEEGLEMGGFVTRLKAVLLDWDENRDGDGDGDGDGEHGREFG